MSQNETTFRNGSRSISLGAVFSPQVSLDGHYGRGGHFLQNVHKKRSDAFSNAKFALSFLITTATYNNRTKMIFALIESWRSPLSIGAKIILVRLVWMAMVIKNEKENFAFKTGVAPFLVVTLGKK